LGRRKSKTSGARKFPEKWKNFPKKKKGGHRIGRTVQKRKMCGSAKTGEDLLVLITQGKSLRGGQWSVNRGKSERGKYAAEGLLERNLRKTTGSER